MTNTEHLEWIYQRLAQVHHEDKLMDYMGRLRKIIDDKDADWKDQGWRCCIDHILEPEQPCPICALEKLKIERNYAREENLKLRSLFRRFHVATKQFYEEKNVVVNNCPYDQIVNLYHSILWGFPKIKKLTAKRKTAMRKRWLDDLTTLNDWRDYFKDAGRKQFLIGRNDRGWVANFDFLLREQTIAYMQEGKYDG